MAAVLSAGVRSVTRLACIACLLLCGCRTPPAAAPTSAPAAPPGVEVDAAARRDSEIYRIAAEETDLRILVYRAGRLANLGHNHVIAARNVQGRIYRHPDLRRSSFEMVIPVEAFEVDDVALRRQEGEEFASEPSASDVAGTRRNMLSERVLDAARYPTVTLVGRLTSTGAQPRVDLVVDFKGRSIPLQTTVTLETEGTTIAVSGALEITHAQLGLEPFSVLLGAVQVAETLQLKFRVVAHKEPVS